jgi:hypothetical protein
VSSILCMLIVLIQNIFPSKLRGVISDGGLFREREGCHFPDFDTSSWESRDLSDELLDSAACVGFFVTTFNPTVVRQWLDDGEEDWKLWGRP